MERQLQTTLTMHAMRCFTFKPPFDRILPTSVFKMMGITAKESAILGDVMGGWMGRLTPDFS